MNNNRLIDKRNKLSNINYEVILESIEKEINNINIIRNENCQRLHVFYNYIYDKIVLRFSY
ncbi:MAG: hypothetical protein ACRC3Y_05285 [Romboutsia sp.]|uniref:hypothetical protein n=1 Tax=Romboutsia sp. TaxID=1965302 RepID=UPI003F3BA61D